MFDDVIFVNYDVLAAPMFIMFIIQAVIVVFVVRHYDDWYKQRNPATRMLLLGVTYLDLFCGVCILFSDFYVSHVDSPRLDVDNYVLLPIHIRDIIGIIGTVTSTAMAAIARHVIVHVNFNRCYGKRLMARGSVLIACIAGILLPIAVRVILERYHLLHIDSTAVLLSVVTFDLSYTPINDPSMCLLVVLVVVYLCANRRNGGQHYDTLEAEESAVEDMRVVNTSMVVIPLDKVQIYDKENFDYKVLVDECDNDKYTQNCVGMVENVDSSQQNPAVDSSSESVEKPSHSSNNLTRALWISIVLLLLSLYHTRQKVEYVSSRQVQALGSYYSMMIAVTTLSVVNALTFYIGTGDPEY